jgi:hypothetical protein
MRGQQPQQFNARITRAAYDTDFDHSSFLACDCAEHFILTGETRCTAENAAAKNKSRQAQTWRLFNALKTRAFA